jgi:hypothetical protein
VGEAELLAAHAREALDVRVPGRDVGVADRPVDAVAVAQVGLEVEVAPAVAVPAPEQRLAAHGAALDPGERLVLDVRVLGVVLVEEQRRLVEPRDARLHLLRGRVVGAAVAVAERELQLCVCSWR